MTLSQHVFEKLPFDKFLLAVESSDLSQADKSIIRVCSGLSSCHHSAWERRHYCQLEIDQFDLLTTEF